MKHHLINAAILLAAVALYGVGLTGGAVLAFVAGASLELWFWVRIFRRGAPTRRRPG